MKQSITLLLTCLTCLNLSLMAQSSEDTQDSVEYTRITFMPDDSDRLYAEYYGLCDSIGHIEWDKFIATCHPWVFSFANDTLCIKGVYPLNCYFAVAECKVQETTIDIRFYQPTDGLEELPDCLYDRLIDIRIPGFKAGVYKVGLLGQEHQETTCYGRQKKRLPFVEDGKEWKVGLFPDGSSQASEVELYRMAEDTIVGDIACKRWVRLSMNYDKRNTEYIGAVYERDGLVYEFLPGRDKAVLLYDFATPVGRWVEAYDAYEDRMDSCYIAEKDTLATGGSPLCQTKVWSHPDDETCWLYTTVWTEGIGNDKRPDHNSYNSLGDGSHWLMSCTVGTDTLYYTSQYTEDISPLWDTPEQDVKKQQIDFTHVIKTRPTSPATRASRNVVSSVRLRSAAEQEEVLRGEYNDAVLCIGFEGMDGLYRICVKNDESGKDYYAASQEMSNLQSLDIKLAGLPEGEYTVSIENDGEVFKACLALPLGGTGIGNIANRKWTDGRKYYDLCGRRIAKPGRGLYITEGEKVVIQ